MWNNLEEAKRIVEDYVKQPIIKAGEDTHFHLIQANQTPGNLGVGDEFIIMVGSRYLAQVGELRDMADMDPIQPLYTVEVEKEVGQ
jgi:hypothetical protein